MGRIKYEVGDATRPDRHGEENVVIAHVVNDQGRWGRGFVVAITRLDDGPERAYRRWHRHQLDLNAGPFGLGAVQVVPFGPGAGRLWVANLVAQRGWRRGGDDPQALDIEALRLSLRALYGRICEPFDHPVARVVMPRIGCGLGGARWSDVEPVIEETLCASGIDVTVYSLASETWEDK